MSNVIDTVGDRIQTAILATVNILIALRIEIVVKSMNTSSGCDVACIMVNFERDENPSFNAAFENSSERNNTFLNFNLSDEARGYNLDERGDFAVQRTLFDQQSCTHHISGVFWQKSLDLNSG